MIIALLMEAVTAYCGLILFGIFNHGTALIVPCFLWMALLFAECLLERQFLKKEHSQTLFYLWHGGLSALNLVVLFVAMTGEVGMKLSGAAQSGLYGVSDYIAVAVVSVIVSVRMPILFLNEFSDQQMLVHFELAFLQALFYFVLPDCGYQLPLWGTVCVIAAPVMGMLALTATRSGRSQMKIGRDGFLSPTVFVSLGIFAILTVWSVSAQNSVQTLSKTVATAGSTVFRKVGAWFYKAVLFLSSFFKDPVGDVELDETAAVLNQTAQTGGSSADFSGILQALLGAGILAAVIFVLVILIRARKKKSGTQKQNWNYVNHSNAIYEQNKNLLDRLIFKIRFFLYYIKNRNNIVGKWIRLTAYGRRHGKPWEAGMTIRQYLKQLEQEQQPEEKEALRQLADGLDDYFYSGGNTRLQ